MIGRPPISSWSFANATIEPANETEPISAESDDRDARCRRAAGPASGARLWNSASETSAAAPPPTPLNSATICGIAVIFTRARADRPEHARRSPPPTMIRQPTCTSGCASVTPIATAIPTAPIQLPRRAVVGDERKRSARMKQMIVTR